MTLNVNNPQGIKMDNHILPFTNNFTYLGSTVTTDGGADRDIKQRLAKARAAFKNLQAVWKSSQYTSEQEKAQTVQKLHHTNSFVQFRVLENDRERP